MAVNVIVASDFGSAHKFAREELGLPKGGYAVASSPAFCKGLSSRVTVHLAPGWRRRGDRFTLDSILRYTRANVIDHAEGEVPEAVDEPKPEPTPVKRGPGRPRKV